MPVSQSTSRGHIANEQSRMHIKTLNGLVVLLVSALLGGCDKPNRFADGWERGGNLHDVSLREWAFATDANRLASTADFVREYPSAPDLLMLIVCAKCRVMCRTGV